MRAREDALPAVSLVEKYILHWVFSRKVIPFWSNTKPPRARWELFWNQNELVRFLRSVPSCAFEKHPEFYYCEAFQISLFLRSIPNFTFAKRSELHLPRRVPTFAFLRITQILLFAKHFRPRELGTNSNASKAHRGKKKIGRNHPQTERPKAILDANQR